MNKVCSHFVSREGKVRSRSAISGRPRLKLAWRIFKTLHATRRVPPLEQVQLSDFYDTVGTVLRFCFVI